MFNDKHIFQLWKIHPHALAVHMQLVQATDNSDELQLTQGYAQ